jgi:hypothetical protein
MQQPRREAIEMQEGRISKENLISIKLVLDGSEGR